QFFKEHRAVVGGHLVEDLGDLLLRQRLQQLLLLVVLQILERGRGRGARQNSKGRRLPLRRQFADQVGQIRSRQALHGVPQPYEIAQADSVLKPRLNNLHSASPSSLYFFQCASQQTRKRVDQPPGQDV